MSSKFNKIYETIKIKLFFNYFMLITSLIARTIRNRFKLLYPTFLWHSLRAVLSAARGALLPSLMRVAEGLLQQKSLPSPEGFLLFFYFYSLLLFYYFTIRNSDLLFWACCSSVQFSPQSTLGSVSPKPLPVILALAIPREITYCTVLLALRSESARL